MWDEKDIKEEVLDYYGEETWNDLLRQSEMTNAWALLHDELYPLNGEMKKNQNHFNLINLRLRNNEQCLTLKM